MMVGIVGKANCGKSTFFKAATLMDVLIANYPFATIKPNTGVGFVRVKCVDEFFKVQCNPREGFCKNHQRFIPIQMIDVAGLVPGAHEGKGLGLAFLSDLNQADCLIHVIDASGGTNERGEPVPPGSHDPADDIRFLEVELDYWYLDILKKGWDRLSRNIQMEHADVAKAIAKQMSGVRVDEELAKEVLRKMTFDVSVPKSWTDEQLLQLATAFRKATKPMVIAANKIDTKAAQENIERLRKEFPGYHIVSISAETELALKEAAKHELIDYLPGDADFKILHPEKLSPAQQKALEFMKTEVLHKNSGTGVQAILNTAVFDVLKYVYIFPGGTSKLEDQYGRVLPDCFLMPPNKTALDFAFRLHTDFGKNFIRAIDVKKRMPMAKDHILQNADVIEIMSGK